MVKSADVGTLTSPGLGELKQLINDATLRRAELLTEQAKRKKALDQAGRRLRRAQSLIIRLFTEKAIPRLVDSANAASDELDETEDHLEGCFVEVDFAFDDATRDSYAALLRSFEALRTAQRIWDITATAAVDRVTQRTTANSALTRVRVTFDFAHSDIIRSQYSTMRLGNVAGRDLQIFPGFIMMREASRDFALIEFPQFDCQLAQSRFIEEEFVPSDAEQVGATWKRANKDGSRDRRFNDNYQIPILRYGVLALSSATGLAEVYQISSFAMAAAFVQAIAAHKQALTRLNAPSDLPALAAPSDVEDVLPQEESAPEPAFIAKPRKNLVIDWIVLLVLVGGVGFGGGWTALHRDQISASVTSAFAEPPPVQAIAAPIPPPPKAEKHKGHHRHHHATRPADAGASSKIAPTDSVPNGAAPGA